MGVGSERGLDDLEEADGGVEAALRLMRSSG